MAIKERFTSPVFDLDQYQDLAMATRREDNTHNWQSVYPERIHSELMELISQHGVGLAILMPKEFDDAVDRLVLNEAYPRLPDGMVEEMGDLLWFAATSASYSGFKLSKLCQQSLGTHAAINSFSDLDAAVMCYPERISVLNEFGVNHIDLDANDGRETVEDDPFYLLMRTVRRLTRSMNPSGSNISPSIYAQEIPAPLPEAIADLVNVLAYITNTRLGVPSARIAQFNIDKLQLRSSNNG